MIRFELEPGSVGVQRGWVAVDDGGPVSFAHFMVIVEDGVALTDRMVKARVDKEDVLAAARHLQGIERLDQIRYAVLERGGGISIVPKQKAS